MPSRRILSNKELAPIQKNAVNPFDSFNSDTVNLLTRIVSGGADVIVKGLDVVSTKIYDINGVQYNSLKPGVNIVKSVMSDGSVKVRTVVVK